MTTDWASDVRKYAPEASSEVVAKIARYCGIALQSRDASLVALSDLTEVARVKDGFIRRKLGVDLPEAEVDKALASVAETMKGDRTKNRVTVYYLLAERFDRLSAFH